MNFILFFLSEPRAEMLPESYFLDDELDEDIVLSGVSEEDGASLHTYIHGSSLKGDVVADSSYHGTAAICEAASPRLISNSRRKKKRKSNQNESKTKQGSSSSSSPSFSGVNQTLPMKKESPSLRINPSPPNPASPVNITSPCSPVEASASLCTPKPSTYTALDSSTPTKMSLSLPYVDSTGWSDDIHAWRNVEKRPTSNSITSPATGVNASASESSSATIVSHAEQKKHGCETPLGVAGKSSQGVKTATDNKAQMCLMNKFNAMTKDSVTSWTNEDENSKGTKYPRIRLNSFPAVAGESKGAWVSARNNRCLKAFSLCVHV